MGVSSIPPMTDVRLLTWALEPSDQRLHLLALLDVLKLPSTNFSLRSTAILPLPPEGERRRGRKWQSFVLQLTVAPRSFSSALLVKCWGQQHKFGTSDVEFVCDSWSHVNPFKWFPKYMATCYLPKHPRKKRLPTTCPPHQVTAIDGVGAEVAPEEFPPRWVHGQAAGVLAIGNLGLWVTRGCYPKVHLQRHFGCLLQYRDLGFKRSSLSNSHESTQEANLFNGCALNRKPTWLWQTERATLKQHHQILASDFMSRTLSTWGSPFSCSFRTSNWLGAFGSSTNHCVQAQSLTFPCSMVNLEAHHIHYHIHSTSVGSRSFERS